MAVEADDLVEQLGAEAVHHAHHDDQGGDAEHHRDQADRGDEEDEPLALARQQIAPGDHPLVAGEDHDGPQAVTRRAGSSGSPSGSQFAG